MNGTSMHVLNKTQYEDNYGFWQKLKIRQWFLNQAHSGLWPVRAWFLKIDPVQIVSMHACVCVSTPEAINN